LGPQLITVSGSRASYARLYVAITLRQVRGYLPSRTASLTFGQYQTVLPGDRKIRFIAVWLR